MNKDEYVKVIQDLRTMIKSGKYAKCPCPKTKCEWHGNCHECVMIHRYNNDHLPNCLQPVLIDKIKSIAKTAELLVSPKEKTPDDYWDYVNEVSPLEK